MRKIKNCEPVGYGILVELLSAQEALGTNLIVDESTTKTGAPQGYIRKIGPFVKEAKDYNFQVGDRVIMSGNYTPIPEMECEKGRMFGLVEPHAIKGVLVEGSEASDLVVPASQIIT